MSAAPHETPATDFTRDFALADLDRRFRRPLLAYFGRRVSTTAEAEDLAQDTFERVLRSLERGPIQNTEALVFRIAINLLRDRARRRRARGPEESLPPEAITDLADTVAMDLSVERVVSAENDLADLLAGLEQLEERACGMFYLYRFENLKIREIAKVYGVSASAVEKQIAKALLHLTRWQHRHE